jgi:hypothetical protein
MAIVALIVTVKEDTKPASFTGWTQGPFRPTPLKKSLAVLLFGSVLPVKSR